MATRDEIITELKRLSADELTAEEGVAVLKELKGQDSELFASVLNDDELNELVYDVVEKCAHLVL